MYRFNYFISHQIKLIFFILLIIYGCENYASKQILIDPQIHGREKVQLEITSEEVQATLRIVDDIATRHGMTVQSRLDPEIIVYSYGNEEPKIYCHIDIINTTA